jgi:membrane protein YdbS with pleckstrin-like domain
MSSEQPKASMKNEIKYAVFDGRESLISSIVKDIFSFVTIALLVYVSRDSAWWTLVTGLMFIIWMIVKVGKMLGERHKRFHTKEELIKWAESLD